MNPALIDYSESGQRDVDYLPRLVMVDAYPLALAQHPHARVVQRRRRERELPAVVEQQRARAGLDIVCGHRPLHDSTVPRLPRRPCRGARTAWAPGRLGAWTAWTAWGVRTAWGARTARTGRTAWGACAWGARTALRWRSGGQPSGVRAGSSRSAVVLVVSRSGCAPG